MVAGKAPGNGETLFPLGTTTGGQQFHHDHRRPWSRLSPAVTAKNFAAQGSAELEYWRTQHQHVVGAGAATMTLNWTAEALNIGAADTQANLLRKNERPAVAWKGLKMISIGAIIGGDELSGSRTDRLISRLCRALPRDQDPDPFDINIVFHVPGSAAKPDYSGIRTGSFSAKHKTLMIQVSVPENLMESPELEAFFHKSMIEAVHLAKGFFEKKKIQFNEIEYLRIIQETTDRLERE